MNRGPARRHERGFTLLEIVIALAILAGALTALMQAFSGGLRATAASERQAAAILLARSLLERVGHDIPLAAGERSGVDQDGYRWFVRIESSPLIGRERTAVSPVLPFEILVEVTGGVRPITVTTLRLAPSGFAEVQP